MDDRKGIETALEDKSSNLLSLPSSSTLADSHTENIINRPSTLPLINVQSILSSLNTLGNGKYLDLKILEMCIDTSALVSIRDTEEIGTFVINSTTMQVNTEVVFGSGLSLSFDKLSLDTQKANGKTQEDVSFSSDTESRDLPHSRNCKVKLGNLKLALDLSGIEFNAKIISNPFIKDSAELLIEIEPKILNAKGEMTIGSESSFSESDTDGFDTNYFEDYINQKLFNVGKNIEPLYYETKMSANHAFKIYHQAIAGGNLGEEILRDTSPIHFSHWWNKMYPRGVPLPSPYKIATQFVFKSLPEILSGHTSEIFASAWKPGVSNVLATVSADMTARIWDLNKFSSVVLQHPFDDEEADAYYASLSLAKIDLRSIICKKVLNYSENDMKVRVNKGLTLIDWNARIERLVTAGSPDGLIHIWNEKGKLVFELGLHSYNKPSNRETLGHSDSVLDVKFNTHGDLIVSCGQDGNIILWDAIFGNSIKKIRSHNGLPVVALERVRPNLFVSCGLDNTIQLHEQYTLSVIKTFYHQDMIHSIKVAPGGNFMASSSIDKTVKIWNLASNERKSEHISVLAFKLPASAFTLDWTLWEHDQGPNFNNLVLACGCFDGYVRLFKMDSDTCLEQRLHNAPINSVAFCPGRIFLATGGLDGRVVFLDYKNNRLVGHYNVRYSHGKGIYHLSWDDSGSLLAVSNCAGTVSIYKPLSEFLYI